MNTVPAEASWIKWAGKALENMVKRRVGNEMEAKVNEAFDAAKESVKGSSKGEAGVVTPTGPTVGEHVTGKVTSTSKRGKVIPYTGKFQEIDLRGKVIQGEHVYAKQINVGVQHVKVSEYLDPGFYLIWIDSFSRQPGATIDVLYKNEVEGVMFGYGIIPRKKSLTMDLQG